jgi:serine-type D-Ala-D-Ala carboxypeptidase/endopeptidase (penicillin-binding protein 4)
MCDSTSTMKSKGGHSLYKSREDRIQISIPNNLIDSLSSRSDTGNNVLEPLGGVSYSFPIMSTSIHASGGHWLRFLTIAACISMVPLPVVGQSPPEVFERIFQPSDSWGVAIAEAKTGRILFEHRADTPMMPASNMKVYVTTTAFKYLGTNFRYRTPIVGRGNLDDQGVWHGDLLVRGSGDPTFSGRFEADDKHVTARLERLAQRLLSNGIHRVTGNLYGLDDIYEENYWGRGWPDNAYLDWYTAPSGGLILNDSCLDVGIYPSQPGSPPLIRKLPETESISISNEAKTVKGNGQNSLSLNRAFGSNDFRLTGRIYTGSGPSQVSAAINNPTLFFIGTFKEVLQRQGIQIDGQALDADEAPSLPRRGWRVLAWSESPALTDIARVINTRSQNLFADSLLKTLGYRRAKSGSWAGGEQVVREYLTSLGIPTTTFHMEDGSGLSRLDRVTARGTLQLLLKVQNEGWFSEWKQTLAVSGGSEGSLRKRMTSPLLEGRVFAKTGFIDDVFCISGYVHSRNEKVYAFSLLFNGQSHAGKHPHERMEEALTLLARDEP